MRVDAPTYTQIQVDASPLRRGTRRNFVVVEFLLTLWGSKATLVVDISTKGQMQHYLHSWPVLACTLPVATTEAHPGRGATKFEHPNWVIAGYAMSVCCSGW